MMKRIELLLVMIVALLLWILADNAAAGFHHADANSAHDVYTAIGFVVFVYGWIRFLFGPDPEPQKTEISITLTNGSEPITVIH